MRWGIFYSWFIQTYRIEALPHSDWFTYIGVLVPYFTSYTIHCLYNVHGMWTAQHYYIQYGWHNYTKSPKYTRPPYPAVTICQFVTHKKAAAMGIHKIHKICQLKCKGWLVGTQDGKSGDLVGMQWLLSQPYPNWGRTKVYPHLASLVSTSLWHCQSLGGTAVLV